MSGLTLKKKLELARGESSAVSLMDPMLKVDGKYKVETIMKRVSSLTQRGAMVDKDFPLVYDLNSAEQLGLMLHELGVKGLQVTEKSGQIKTSKDEINAVLEKGLKDFPSSLRLKTLGRYRKH